MATLGIFPNLINLILCLIWLSKKTSKNPDSATIVISIVFTLGSITAFIASMFIQGDYLDFAGHIYMGFGSTILFWILSIILVISIRLKQNNKSKILFDILQLSVALLFPLFVWNWMTGLSLKIGG